MKAPGMLTLIMVVYASAHAANFSDPIQDQSPSGSPVSSAGNIIISVKPLGNGKSVVSHSDEWKAKNVSDKPIVAMVATLSIRFTGGDELSVVHQYEAFFHPRLANPGDEINLSADSQSERIMKADALDQPLCEVVLRWAQFADGTTFGDKQYAKDLLDARRDTWSALAHLNEVYESKGAAEFSKSLQQPVQASANGDGYIEHLRIFEKQHGTEGAVARLKEHLLMAEKRSMLDREFATQP